jgi:Ala-tRNA(Pro) deacylase
MLYQKIINFLKENNIDYEEIRHAAVKTSDEACKVRGCKPEEGAKALVFIADKTPIQIIIEGNKKIDKRKFKNLFKYKDLQMASAEKLKEITTVEPGAVPPFGNLFSTPIKIYCNKTLLDNEYIEFNAGDHCISIRMKAIDWHQIINPVIEDFAEQSETVIDPIILSIDYGEKKIGSALYKNNYAMPLKVLENKPNTGIEMEALKELTRVIQEENIEKIIMGIPFINGKETIDSQKIRQFGNKLKKIVNKQILYIDESYTTVEATEDIVQQGISKTNRSKDDGFSAVNILKRYLENKKV